MQKIGTTSSGTVIVEMTVAQFDAITQLQAPQVASEAKTAPDQATMSLAKKVEYVRSRIVKLKPKKKDGLIRSISTMFQFNGGISEKQAQDVVARLEKEKFLAIENDGKVTFLK